MNRWIKDCIKYRKGDEMNWDKGGVRFKEENNRSKWKNNLYVKKKKRE